MDVSLLTAIISGIGVVLVAFIGFIGQRKGTLSSAENTFRDTIIKENDRLRKRIDEVEDENQKLQRRILKLESALIKAGVILDEEDHT